MELFEWIEKRLKPELVDSVGFMYDEMESQSGFCLPIIYQPFDATKRAHWRDRGSLFDFLYATGCEGKRVLDFGPGDGWPSLIIAAHVQEVIGVDGSHRRVSVCEENAKRLNIKNARFIHVAPGQALPFDNDVFDGIVAASSVEQTPDARLTLREFYRVLKPGGRLRIDYEPLSIYKNGKECELFFDSDDKGNCTLTLYNRHITKERADMYKIRCAVGCEKIFPIFLEREARIEDVSFNTLSIEKLDRMMSSVVEVKKCVLTHACGKTYVQWMGEVGFGEILPSRSGATVAGEIFDATPPGDRPRTMGGVDKILKPAIQEDVEKRAELANDPPITAAKGANE
jgi:ubiquinone/menaquinone biosynthesis C-methylase UbiE